MAVKILISRIFNSGAIVNALPVLSQMGRAVNAHKGYLGCDVYSQGGARNVLYTISEWESMTAWENWNTSPEKLNLMKELRPHLASAFSCRLVNLTHDVHDPEAKERVTHPDEIHEAATSGLDWT